MLVNLQVCGTCQLYGMAVEAVSFRSLCSNGLCGTATAHTGSTHKGRLSAWHQVHDVFVPSIYIIKKGKGKNINIRFVKTMILYL